MRLIPRRKDFIDYIKQTLISSLAFSIGIRLAEWVKKRRSRAKMHLRRKKRDRKASSLQESGRSFAVVTTAALPWRTGTSINPMLRVAHLASDPNRRVMLVVPWIASEDQQQIYPTGVRFDTQEQQAEYILSEARKRTSLPCNFSVKFYQGKYFSSFGSIFPVEDIVKVIPEDMHDVAILEEPEHLNWFQYKSRWTSVFQHVVGIMHTNYLAYVKEGQSTGYLNAAAVYRVNRWVCKIHCHKNIRLSGAVQKLPHQVTCNVHGVAGLFLDIGRAKAAKPPPGQHRFTKGAYFIGKAVWGKGYRELINLGAEYEAARPEPLVMDVIGDGEDLKDIQAYARQKGLNWRWFGGKDHADESMHDYQVFLNPSTSDVVATTTAEALAMGKWVVVADIPCNTFFKQFRNCLMYTDAAGFVSAVERALTHEPTPMSDAELRKLSWEAATERLLDVGSLSAHDWPSSAEIRYTAALWRMYRGVVGFTALREALGMTSTTGTDVPIEVSETEEISESEEETNEPPAAATQNGSVHTAPTTAMTPEQRKTAKLAAAQAELEKAKSAHPEDFDMDWAEQMPGSPSS